MATSVVSQGALFRGQATLATVTGLALLARPSRLSWAAALVVAGSAFGAVMLYRYVDAGTLGPIPDMYEPNWVSPGKLASAWAEGASPFWQPPAFSSPPGRTTGLLKPARHQPDTPPGAVGPGRNDAAVTCMRGQRAKDLQPTGATPLAAAPPSARPASSRSCTLLSAGAAVAPGDAATWNGPPAMGTRLSHYKPSRPSIGSAYALSCAPRLIRRAAH